MSEGEEGSGLTQLISPQDNRLYSIPRGQEEAYKKAGYIAPAYDINKSEIKEHFNGWSGAGQSFLVSTLGGVPFAKSLIAGVSSKEQAAAWRESFDAAQREHPYLDFLGRATGTIGGAAGELALGGAALGAAGGALGLGGAAAAEAAGGLAAGSEVAAGALGAGEAAATGVAGVEAAGAAGAATEAAPVAQSVLNLGGKGIKGAMIEGAVTNAALGHIARIDDSALAHAADPEGKEKIQWMLNEHDLFDAAFGAAVPGAFGAFGKGLGYIGRKLDTKGLTALRDAFSKAGEQEAIARQGRTGDLSRKLDEVIESGRQSPIKYVKAQVKNAGKDMQDAIEATRKSALTEVETRQLKRAMRKVLGPDNRLYPRIADFTKKAEWNVEDMKALNQKVYAEIEFDEPGLRKEQDAAYLRAADLVKNGMHTIFTRVDPTGDQALAQRWAAALKNESDWLLAQQVVKRGNRPKSLSEIFRAMGSNALLAGGASAAFGGFGVNPITAAATGAGFAALRDINVAHYGMAARFFGKHMTSAGDRLAGAVEAGLYGTPSLLHTLTTRREYEDTASKLSAIRNDPQTAFVNIGSAMQQAGFPEHIAEDAALAQHSQTQFLAARLPSRMTAPDVVSRGQGDPVQQRRLMGQVRTMRDPTYGVLYPTKTNMEVLQKFYPNVLFNTQQAVLSQLQKNPNLPATSKLWASRVLGRPINNLSSPTFFATMNAARQKAAQAEQAQQQGAPAQRRSTSGGPSSATRLDELQGAGQ